MILKRMAIIGRRSSRGFTLVELAVVLVIVALLLAAVLGPLGTRVEAGDRQRAENELSDIKEAIYGFAMANGRLPCADTDNDGVENVAACTGAATVAVGTLPWQDLQVPQQDPWVNPYVYAVTTTFADALGSGTSALCPTAAVQAAFNLCEPGAIDVVEDPSDPVNTRLAIVPAVILSFGKNRNDPALTVGGVLSAYENENFNGDTRFVFKIFSRLAAEEFDDLVVWISPNVLKNRMVVAGRLP